MDVLRSPGSRLPTDYAALPIADAFNWQAVAAELPAMASGIWWPSGRSAGPAPTRRACARFDELAHHEAAAAPGFVHYFKGPRPPTAVPVVLPVGQTGPTPAPPPAGPPTPRGEPDRRDVRALHARVPPRVPHERRSGASVRAYDRPGPRPDLASRDPLSVRPAPALTVVIGRRTADSSRRRPERSSPVSSLATSSPWSPAPSAAGSCPPSSPRSRSRSSSGSSSAAAGGRAIRGWRRAWRSPAQRLLRLGIVLLGARLSFEQIAGIGLPARRSSWS